MPASPAEGEQYAARVLPLVEDLEGYLFGLIRDALLADADAPDWAMSRLAQLQRLRAQAERATERTMRRLERLVSEVVLYAYNHGTALALNDAEILGVEVGGRPLPTAALSESLTQVAVAKLADAASTLPRLFTAVYSEAVAVGALEVATNRATRLQAAQHVLDRLLSDGVRGFRDRGGRNWSLESYVEMAVRTVTGQSAVLGYTDQLARVGIDLVQVSDSPRECPLCRPWEGEILSIGGQIGAVFVAPATGGAPVLVKTAGTVAAAKSAGLQHPNCTHRLTAYLPGATKVVQPQANPAGYVAKQRQREIERAIRRWKRREQLALTDETAGKARAKVRDWQGSLREHIDANDLKRLRYREQIGTEDAPLAR